MGLKGWKHGVQYLRLTKLAGRCLLYLFERLCSETACFRTSFELKICLQNLTVYAPE